MVLRGDGKQRFTKKTYMIWLFQIIFIILTMYDDSSLHYNDIDLRKYFSFDLYKHDYVACFIVGTAPPYGAEVEELEQERSCCCVFVKRQQEQTRKSIHELEGQMYIHDRFCNSQELDMDRLQNRLADVERDWDVLNRQALRKFREQRILKEQIQQLRATTMSFLVVFVFVIVVVAVVITAHM